MSTFTKERNIITFSIDGVNGNYVLDLATCQMTGLRGGRLENFPRRRELVNILSPYAGWSRSYPSYLAFILSTIIDNNSRTNALLSRQSLILKAEKIDAIGFPVIKSVICSTTRVGFLGDNIRYLVEWLKTHPVEEFNYDEFSDYVNYGADRKKYGVILDSFPRDVWMRIKRYKPAHIEITQEMVVTMVYYLIHGKMWEYDPDELSRLWRWIDMCIALGKPFNRQNNFFREYVETKREYDLRKEEFDSKKMIANYAQHAKAWDFAFGDYVVVVPTTPKEIIDEGANMHHCVGSYVGSVIRNETYIVFVRHKDSPDKCYITCQVHTDGRMGQYFLAYDNYISSDEDKAFQRAFREHILNNW